VTSLRRLIVMRHARAEPFASSDQERRLTERGLAGARDAGKHLAEFAMLPDQVVVSPATRTVETWEAVREACAVDAAVRVEAGAYTGSPDVVLEALRSVPEDSKTLLYIGHNPTAAYLVHLLDDGNGDPDAVTGLLQGYPAGALAVLEVETPWSELAPETARVVDFYVGHD
jgi:phosphohistidine phosphatase